MAGFTRIFDLLIFVMFLANAQGRQARGINTTLYHVKG